MSEELIISQQEIDENEILACEDMLQVVVREQGGFSNIIYTAIEAPSINKRVLTVPQYVEEYRRGRLISRRAVDHVKISQAISDIIDVADLIVVGTEKV